MKARQVQLEECAEILPGLSLKARAEHEPNGTHQVILMKHIDEDVPYVFTKEHELRISFNRPVDRYLVHAGDLLFASRGIKNKTVMIENVPKNTVVSSSFYLLRAKDNINAGYLGWVLNQSRIQAMIGEVRTGAGTPLVQRSELMELTIPVPPVENQLKIAELNNLMAKERQLRKGILEQTITLHKSISSQVFAGMNKR